MLYSSHVTSCHILFKQNLHDTRLHPHVISMARWAPGGLRSGGATSTAALSSRYRRGGVAMWRCYGIFTLKSWETAGRSREIGENSPDTAWPKRSGWEQGPAGFPVGISPSKQHHALQQTMGKPAKVHDSVTIMELKVKKKIYID